MNIFVLGKYEPCKAKGVDWKALCRVSIYSKYVFGTSMATGSRYKKP